MLQLNKNDISTISTEVLSGCTAILSIRFSMLASTCCTYVKTTASLHLSYVLQHACFHPVLTQLGPGAHTQASSAGGVARSRCRNSDRVWLSRIIAPAFSDGVRDWWMGDLAMLLLTQMHSAHLAASYAPGPCNMEESIVAPACSSPESITPE